MNNLMDTTGGQKSNRRREDKTLQLSFDDDLRARGREPEKIPQKFRALPAAGVFCQGEDHLSKMKICG